MLPLLLTNYVELINKSNALITLYENSYNAHFSFSKVSAVTCDWAS